MRKVLFCLVLFWSLIFSVTIAFAADDITTRAPLPTDDVNAGYQVGDTWWIGRVPFRQGWQNVRNTAGKASWQAILAPNAGFLDNLSPHPAALWGANRRWLSYYTGTACTATTGAGDCSVLYWNGTAAKAVAFSAANANLVDWASVDQNCLTAACAIYGIKDQMNATGAGLDLGAFNGAGSANQLTYTMLANGERYLMWDEGWRSEQGVNNPAALLNTSATWNNQAFSIAVLGTVHDAGHQLLAALGSAATTNETIAWVGGVLGISDGNTATPATSISSAPGPGNYGLYVFTSSSTRICLYVNDRGYCNTTPATAGSGTGLIFGYTSSTAFSPTAGTTPTATIMDAVTLGYWTSALAASDVANYEVLFASNTDGFYPQLEAGKKLIAIGDSGCEAQGNGFNQGWFEQLASMIRPQYGLVNACMSGATLAQVPQLFNNLVATDSNNGSPIIVMEMGSNDAGANTTALGDCAQTQPTMQCRAQTAVALIRAKYPNAYIVWVPLLDRNGSMTATYNQFIATKTAWNNWLSANCRALIMGPGACVPADDPDLFALNANQSSAFFNADHVHPTGPGMTIGGTSGGYGRLAADIYATLAPYLAKQ